MHGNFVPVATVEVTDFNEVVRKPTGQWMARHVLDVEFVQAEKLRHRKATQPVEFLSLPDEILSQPELMVALNHVILASGRMWRNDFRICFPILISSMSALPVRGVRSKREISQKS